MSARTDAMDRRVVQTSGFDGQQNLIDHRLTAVSAECCNGDGGLHAAYETGSDLPVWRVLQEGSSLSVSDQSCKILQHQVVFLHWSSITERQLPRAFRRGESGRGAML